MPIISVGRLHFWFSFLAASRLATIFLNLEMFDFPCKAFHRQLRCCRRRHIALFASLVVTAAGPLPAAVSDIGGEVAWIQQLGLPLFFLLLTTPRHEWSLLQLWCFDATPRRGSLLPLLLPRRFGETPQHVSLLSSLHFATPQHESPFLLPCCFGFVCLSVLRWLLGRCPCPRSSLTRCCLRSTWS